MPSWKELKTNHYFYRKFDENGNIRCIKVSKGTGEIRKNLWNEILKKQLQVDKEYFNSKI